MQQYVQLLRRFTSSGKLNAMEFSICSRGMEGQCVLTACVPISPGDLLYLDVVTLEGVEHYVTACPSGFYLNRSIARDTFDPTPKKTSHLSTHLVGLLSLVSEIPL